MGTSSLLAGLVQGYTKAQTEKAHEELAGRAMSRDAMLQYLGHMASNPNVPTEHQQWALQKASELAQADITKKLPKVDLGELPAAQLHRAGQQAVTQMPGMTLQAPQGPPGMVPPPQGQQGPPAPSGDVGKASNGTVNALGSAAGGLPPLTVPNAPPAQLQLPAGPQTIVSTPGQTTQLSAPGQVHLLTEAEKSQQQNEILQERVNQLQQANPDASRSDLLYMAIHGEMPKPDTAALQPGESLVEKRTGREIARNEQAKPGAKSGYEFDPATGGVKDLAKGGGVMTPEEVAANPHAKAVLDQGNAHHAAVEKEQEAKEARQAERQAASQARAFNYAQTGKIQADAIKASRAAAPMVNVLDASEDYLKKGNFTPRQDLALIVRAVRAMNPGTVRLPNTELEMEIKAGSYGDRFKRWYTTSTSGTLPNDQRQDLMKVIREETTQTAQSAADNWKQAYGDEKALPSHLKRFALKSPQGPAASSGGGFDWSKHPVVNGK